MAYPPGRDDEPGPFPTMPRRTGLEDPFDVFGAAPEPAPPPRDRIWLHILLLLLTIGSTTLVGACHYLSFEQGFEPAPPMSDAAGRDWILGLFAQPSFYLHGLWYSVTVLGILGCHEMGHYVACLSWAAIGGNSLQSIPSARSPFLSTWVSCSCLADALTAGGAARASQ